MAKKERNFYGELDWLRYQLRELAKEQGVEIKNTNIMKKEECKEKIDSLNKEKYRKDLVSPNYEEILKNLKEELADRDNQITELKKERKAFEKSSAEVLKEKYEKIDILERDRKELQEINKSNLAAIEASTKKLAENRKEIEEKNKEIAELKAERTASQISLKKKEENIMELRAMLTDKINMIERLNNKKWYQFWKK